VEAISHVRRILIVSDRRLSDAPCAASGVEESGGSQPAGQSVADHIRFVDIPFAISYLALAQLYAWTTTPTDSLHELQLQAFLGGASAFEMLMQSTIHAFSKVGRAY
jgi:hypothetical protein